MDTLRVAVYASLGLSLVVIPAAFTVQLRLVGLPPTDGLGFHLLAVVMLAPGLLMGLAGALVAARG